MTSQYWDKHVKDVESHVLKGWLDWEFIEENYIRPQISGSPTVYYLHHFLQQHVPRIPVSRALSIGCGGGNLERALVDLNAAQDIDAVDISTESIRLAQQLAEQQGMKARLHYEVQDVDTMVLPEKIYDFVIAKMSLHHITRLEHVYRQIRRTLKPGGLFVFNEFIGPSRFQWTDLQLRLMEQILSVLPKKNTFSSIAQTYITLIERPTIPAMLVMDPSEAVRSSEIMVKLPNDFDVVEYKPYGGALLHMLLTHTMPSYDLESPDQQALLKLLFLFEKTLIEHGVLQSDFAYVVARAKPLDGTEKPIVNRRPWRILRR